MDNGTPKYKRIILKVTGEVFAGPIERQTELVLEQLKLCLEHLRKRSRKLRSSVVNWRW